MALLVAALGAVVLAIALAGVAAPRALADRLTGLGGPGLLAFASGFRLVIAVVLWLGAGECRHPAAVQVIAVLALIGAVVAPALGTERIRAMIRWWASQPSWLVRAWGGVAAGIGGFLIYTSV